MKKFIFCIMTGFFVSAAYAIGGEDAGHGCAEDIGYYYVYSAEEGLDDCVTYCDPGYAVLNAREACVQLDGVNESRYTDARHAVIYGQTSGKNLKTCPSSPTCTGDIFYPIVAAAGLHDTINKCYCSGLLIRISIWPYEPSLWGSEPPYGESGINTHGTGYTACYYVSGTDGNAIYGPDSEFIRGCINGMRLVTCDAGFYDARDGQFVDGPVSFQACQPVGYDFYSPDGDIARYPCPSGTKTCGYGDCADDISDCMPIRTLNIENGKQLILWSQQKSSPTICVKTPDDNKIWYGMMTSVQHDNTLQIRQPDGTQYSAINPMDSFYKFKNEYWGQQLYNNPEFEIYILPEIQ